MPRKKVSKKRAPAQRRRPRSNRASIMRTLGGYAPAIGGYIGNAIAPGIGGAVGSGVGSLIASIAGHGAYTVNYNTIAFPDQVPLFDTKRDGAIRMIHREFITDIVSNSVAGAFQVQSFPIDVADPTTFPYFSQIAANFEEWRMNGLIFEYKTTSGSISSTGQLGTAILATQYNSNALPFTSKQAMEAYTFASSTVVSASVIHPVECDPKQTPSNGLFYTNVPGTSPSSSSSDLRWQQLGNFSIATQGCAASENLGELWVSYDCELLRPRLIQATGALADHYTATAGITTAAYFGTNGVRSQASDNFTNYNATQILFRNSVNGRFQITYIVAGAAGAWATPTFTPGAGAKNVNMLINGTLSQVSYTTSGASVVFTSVYYVDITSVPAGALLPGVGAIVTLSGGTFFTPTSMDLLIEQIPTDFS